MTERGNPRTSGAALCGVRDEIEALMISSGYCVGAPFSWVTISIRYGFKNTEKPFYQPINKKYGDLPLTIEVSREEMDDSTLEEIKNVFRRAVLRSLIHAGEKYARPIDELMHLYIKQRANK